MGAAATKLADDLKDDSSESSVPYSAPILTPQIKKLDWDPRSPSSDISRTPIEVLKTPITSNGATPNVSEGLNDDIEHNPLNRLLSVDPRSPTTEFHRTPIVIDAVPTLTLHNKNLDNAREPLVVVTPAKPKRISQRVVKKICATPEADPTKPVSPKLLESSPITVKPPENKRHSVVGLLETNIDFVETDLDEVIQSKLCNCLEVEESPKHFFPSLEDNPSENPDLHRDPESDYEAENDILGITSHNKENCMFAAKTDDTLEITHEVSKLSVKNACELDRKLTNLIYEDKQSETSPKPNKPADNNHTPLRDRNTNSQQVKSIPKLRVSDKPTKPFVVSRIPVFQEKKLKGKINVQCENTPPRMKPKRSQWDAEDSIII